MGPYKGRPVSRPKYKMVGQTEKGFSETLLAKALWIPAETRTRV
jgi:hypothetical protein